MIRIKPRVTESKSEITGSLRGKRAFSAAIPEVGVTVERGFLYHTFNEVIADTGVLTFNRTTGPPPMPLNPRTAVPALHQAVSLD